MQSDHGTLDPVKEGTRNSFREKRGQKSGKCERPCLIRQWPLSRLCRAKLFLNWYYWLFLVWPTSDCHADKRDILPDLCIDKSVSLCPVWFYSCCLSIHVSFSRRDTRFCVTTFRGFRGLESVNVPWFPAKPSSFFSLKTRHIHFTPVRSNPVTSPLTEMYREWV